MKATVVRARSADEGYVSSLVPVPGPEVRPLIHSRINSSGRREVPPMAAKGGESKAGLVTFLVLFILVAITLGVTTYYGYDAADKAAKDKVEADKKAKAWENDANWYKYVADTYALYMGQQAPKGDDVGALRQQVGTGANAQDK